MPRQENTDRTRRSAISSTTQLQAAGSGSTAEPLADLARDVTLRRAVGRLGVVVLTVAACASCSLTVDADRQQCTTDRDCVRHGAAFAGSTCLQGLCQPASIESSCDAGRECSDAAAIKLDGCVGTGCRLRDAQNPPMRDAQMEEGEKEEKEEEEEEEEEDAAREADDTQLAPDAQSDRVRECSVDDDCEKRGILGAVCVDEICWKDEYGKSCVMDPDCAAYGPDFVGGRCVGSMCLPNPKWRCEPPAPLSGDKLSLKILVRDSLSLSPLTGVRAQICQKLDLDCVEPSLQVTSDREGYFVFEVPSTFAGYVQIKDAQFYPALYSLPAVLPSDGELQPLPLIDATVANALALALGGLLDDSRGHLMLIAEDCFGMPLAGAAFESSQADASTVQFYVRDLLPVLDATETADAGNGGFVNYPVGNAVISVRVVETGLAVRTVSLVVRPATISVAYVRPELR